MTILRYLSTIYTALLAPVLLFLLFEFRYPPKKTILMTLAFMVPIVIVNGFLLTIVGHEQMSTLLLISGALPALGFFFLISRYRDFRLLFTFCFTSTIKLIITDLTSIIDFYFGETYLVMSLSRLAICPIVVFAVWKWLRPVYLQLQRNVRKGWRNFSAIAICFHLLITLSYTVPTHITDRPEQLPAFLLLLILPVFLYIHIFATMDRQHKAFEAEQQRSILTVQVDSLLIRVAEFDAANENLHEERHNFRHKMRTLAALAEKGDLDSIRATVQDYTRALSAPAPESYCKHHILDAVFSSYLQEAERKLSSVNAKIDIPDVLPVAESEFATVLANALENAIQACEQVELPNRILEIKSITYPCFMLQIRNSFDGMIAFDEDGMPMATRQGHGFGTRSIATFCEKNNIFYEFMAEDNAFTLRFVFNT